MAKHSYEKARWNRREARRHLQVGKWQMMASYPRLFLYNPTQFLGDRPAVPATVWKQWQRRWVGYEVLEQLSEEEKYRLAVLGTQMKLSDSAHDGLSNYTRTYRRLWRRRGHEQERLHLLELHDEAQELEPQPRKLGVMWDIW